MPAQTFAKLPQLVPRPDACLPTRRRRWHWSDLALTHVQIPWPPHLRPRSSEIAPIFSTACAPNENGCRAAQGRVPKPFGIRVLPSRRNLGSRKLRQRLDVSKSTPVPPEPASASSRTQNFRTISRCGRELPDLVDRDDLIRSPLPWPCRVVVRPYRPAPTASRTFASLRNRKRNENPFPTQVALPLTALTRLKKLREAW